MPLLFWQAALLPADNSKPQHGVKPWPFPSVSHPHQRIKCSREILFRILYKQILKCRSLMLHWRQARSSISCLPGQAGFVSQWIMSCISKAGLFLSKQSTPKSKLPASTTPCTALIGSGCRAMSAPACLLHLSRNTWLHCTALEQEPFFGSHKHPSLLCYPFKSG